MASLTLKDLESEALVIAKQIFMSEISSMYRKLNSKDKVRFNVMYPNLHKLSKASLQHAYSILDTTLGAY